jgi:hypothetical protein
MYALNSVETNEKQPSLVTLIDNVLCTCGNVGLNFSSGLISLVNDSLIQHSRFVLGIDPIPVY